MKNLRMKHIAAALMLAATGPLAQAAGPAAERETDASGTILLIFIFMLVAFGLSLRNWAEMKTLQKKIANGEVAVGASGAPSPMAGAPPMAQGDDIPAVIAAAAAVAVGGRPHVVQSIRPARPTVSAWTQSGRTDIHQSHKIERKYS